MALPLKEKEKNHAEALVRLHYTFHMCPLLTSFGRKLLLLSDIFQTLVSFRKQICLRFPQLKTFFYSSPSSSNQDPKQKFIDMVLQNKSNNYCCHWLLEIEDGSLVQESQGSHSLQKSLNFRGGP